MMQNHLLALLIVILHVSGFIAFGQDESTEQSVPSPTPVYSESTLYVPRKFPKESRKVKDPKSSARSPSAKSLAVPVTVIDRAGDFVRGLTKDDFEVYVDDQQKEIVGFKSDDEPINMIFLIDVSPSTEYSIADVRKFLTGTLDKLRPEDRISVIRFDRQTKLLQELTTDRNGVLKAIKKLEFGDGTSLYEAVGIVSKNYLNSLDTAAGVVLFTDGVDTTSSRRIDYARSLLLAQQSTLSFHPLYIDTFQQAELSYRNARNRTGLHLNGLGRLAKKDYDIGQEYLEDLLNLTGGLLFLYPEHGSTIDLPNVLRRKYSLIVNVNNSDKTKLHQIKVRVRKPGLTIASKRTFAFAD